MPKVQSPFQDEPITDIVMAPPGPGHTFTISPGAQSPVHPVSAILRAVVAGDEPYVMERSYVRWGKVEEDLKALVDGLSAECRAITSWHDQAVMAAVVAERDACAEMVRNGPEMTFDELAAAIQARVSLSSVNASQRGISNHIDAFRCERLPAINASDP